MRFVVIRGPEPAGPFELVPGPNVLGRDPAADIRLPSKRVSRRHAVAVMGTDSVLVRDMDSANGLVDESGRRQSEIVVRPGQRVQVGDFVLRLEGVATGDLELDLDDPLTAEDDLLLDNDHEDTPLPRGPMPVMRPSGGARVVPDPGRVTIDAHSFPAGAPAPKPAPPKPAVAAAPLLQEHPTAETSARMPPPVLPFGPATGSFGGFVAHAPAPASAPPPRAPTLPVDDRTPLSTPTPRAAPPPQPPPEAPPLHARYQDDPHTASDTGQRASTRIPALRRGGGESPAVGGPPWLAQAAGVLLLAGSIVVCAPLGGLGAQLGNASAVAEELSLQRGEALAEGLANRNGDPLAAQRYISLDTASVLQAAGVRQAALTDLNGTVVAPPERARQSLARSPGWAAAAATGSGSRVEGADGTWEILAPVRGEAATGSGARKIVGWAWLVYDPDVAADSATSPLLRAFAAFMVVLGAAGVLVAGAWWLVLRPLAALRDETEHALHDHVDRVVPAIRWGALEDLASSINRVLLRARDR